MIKWLRQFIQRLDTEYIGLQEFYGLGSFALVVSGAVVFLMSDRLVRNARIDVKLALRNQEMAALQRSADSLEQWMAENAICQYLNIDQPGDDVIEAVEVRYDSAQIIYERLIGKGWRFESFEMFKEKHLPSDWRVRLNRNENNRQQITERLVVKSAEASQAALAHESYIVFRNRMLRYGLLLIFVLVFPMRWLYLYGYKKRGLKFASSIR